MKRYLSKSRFKLGLECPTKLYYTNKKEYANQKKEDDFLEALAQGGFQVEELARLEYDGGILVNGNPWDYDILLEKTNKLLKQENVIIYEPAFLYNNCFVRVDILVKKGDTIELIEVKAKSINSNDEFSIIGKRGKLRSEWRNYLFDIAFQEYVMKNAFSNWRIKPYLLLIDKSKTATVDGLNQKFKITSKSNKRTGIIVKEGTNKVDIGESILTKIPVDSIIANIKSGVFKYDESLTFKEAIQLFTEYYSKDIKINSPVNVKCKNCEFYTVDDNNLKSGYIECWTEQLNVSKETIINEPKVYEVGNFKSASKLIERGTYLMKDIEEDDITVLPKPYGLSISERQWLQISKVKERDNTPYIDIDGLKLVMSSWKFPLHFIDFETSTVAIPFNKGKKPYEQIAFQFSHHKILEDGSISHETEYINSEAGNFPNFDFLRNLRTALSLDVGSIFKYSYHENTILNAIHEQLISSNEKDKDELIDFIKSISHSKKDSVISWVGDRDMIDLCEMVKLYYYDPQTKGSNSIKAVLPAVLNSSGFLKNKYSKSIKEISLSSLNFNDDKVFIEFDQNDKVISPYKSLPQLFDDWSEDELDSLMSDLEGIDNGGSALIAYSKLQFQEMNDAERQEIRKALLMYCEIDTLAMVMIYEFFKESIKS
ncbi:DUF2779 domain-containing protein [uncultured Kriegella sp.]|uniref:DUF2779 domain-containing protein n=1 Tax=uncultured Kriegella sp. TaxID=1798910 RepID=UPI0030DA87FA|tara:strand:- start:271 stop:2235 length:1965 start_codon:yes stop_codon:yes gene_type:complete